jgi:hypothetical protein
VSKPRDWGLNKRSPGLRHSARQLGSGPHILKSFRVWTDETSSAALGRSARVHKLSK